MSDLVKICRNGGKSGQFVDIFIAYFNATDPFLHFLQSSDKYLSISAYDKKSKPEIAQIYAILVKF